MLIANNFLSYWNVHWCSGSSCNACFQMKLDFQCYKNKNKHCTANWPYNWVRLTRIGLSTEIPNLNKMFFTKLPEYNRHQTTTELGSLRKKHACIVYIPADVSDACLLPVVWFLTFLALAGVHIPPWLDAQNPEAPADFVHDLLAAPSLLFEP